ncbi:MAG: nucleoside hydrolase [Candidatus Bathyarchaeota archaeon]|nr:nucleoside hydrolase [Candidatus Bathyarchaeota archaeon]
MKRIILDTDPGVDDALAFLLAFSSPEIKVEAVTTVDGNVDVEKGTQNARQLLEFLGRTDVPVARGANHPMLRSMQHAESYHGRTGLMDAILPETKMKIDKRGAAQLIIDEVGNRGKDLTIVAIGPLTNIAIAVLADPTIPEKVNGLVIMGGAFGLTPYGTGNANAVAEFNIWHDPDAAKLVFDSGIPITCIGLDTTTHPDYRMSKAMYGEIVAMETKRSKLIEGLCGTLVERFNGFSLHDPMAMAYIADPTMFKTEKYRVEVETVGTHTLGMTVVDRRRFHRQENQEVKHEVIIEVNAPRFHRMIMDRVAKGG